MKWDLTKIEDFEWDDFNVLKNWENHKVSTNECEQIFFNKNKFYLYDATHSQSEDRFIIFGITDEGRLLMMVFTIRKNKIRVISARDQSKKEKTYFLSKFPNE